MTSRAGRTGRGGRGGRTGRGRGDRYQQLSPTKRAKKSVFEQLAEANKRHTVPGQTGEKGSKTAMSNKDKLGKGHKVDGNKEDNPKEKKKDIQEEDEIEEYDDDSSKEESEEDNSSSSETKKKDEQDRNSNATQGKTGKDEEEEEDYDLSRALPRHLRGKWKNPPSPAKSTNSDESMLDGSKDKFDTPEESDKSVSSEEEPDTPTKSNRGKTGQCQKKTKEGQTTRKPVNPYFNRKKKVPQMYTKTPEELNGREKIERYDLRMFVPESNNPVGTLRDTLLGIFTQLQQADPGVALCPYRMEHKRLPLVTKEANFPKDVATMMVYFPGVTPSPKGRTNYCTSCKPISESSIIKIAKQIPKKWKGKMDVPPVPDVSSKFLGW